tara:strand:- start:256 stop:555 length:300 start_codon:yes stop_codon:yes gene_type:complete
MLKISDVLAEILEEEPFALRGDGPYKRSVRTAKLDLDCKKGFLITDKKFHAVASKLAGRKKRVYPPIGEQLDMIYWDKVNGTNNWIETINSIKKGGSGE